MGNYNFTKDLPLGQKGERIIQIDLERLGGEVVTYNETNAYDLMMQMPVRGEDRLEVVTYEVKTDVFCKPHNDTANLFIEFECRGNASGIAVTKANWFVTYYPYLFEAWYIKVDELKSIISDNDFKVAEGSGDAFSNTKGYLIPRYQYKTFFKVRKIPKAWLKTHFE